MLGTHQINSDHFCWSIPTNFAETRDFNVKCGGFLILTISLTMAYPADGACGAGDSGCRTCSGSCRLGGNGEMVYRCT